MEHTLSSNTRRAYDRGAQWFLRFCDAAGLRTDCLARGSERSACRVLSAFALYLLRGLDDVLAAQGVPPSQRPRVSAVSTVLNYISGVGSFYAEQGWVASGHEVRARANRGGFPRFVRAIRRRAPERPGSAPLPPSVLRDAISFAWPSRPFAPRAGVSLTARSFDRQMSLVLVLWVCFHALLRVGEVAPVSGTGFSEREDVARRRLIGWFNVEVLDASYQPITRASSGAPRHPPSGSAAASGGHPAKVRLQLDFWKWNDPGRAQTAEVVGLPGGSSPHSSRRWILVVDGSADGLDIPHLLLYMRERLARRYGLRAVEGWAVGRYGPGPSDVIRESTVADALRRACRSHPHYSALDPSSISGHSLRKGGTTAQIRAGVPLQRVQSAGRWLHLSTMLSAYNADDLAEMEAGARAGSQADFGLPGGDRAALRRS